MSTRFILFISLLLFPSLCFSYELPAAHWNTSTGSFDFQGAVNHKPFLSPVDVSLPQKFERDAVKVLMPDVIQGTAGGVAAAEMYAVTGAGASAGFLRRAIGLAGGIGTVITLGMAAKDLYDWANSSDANKAMFNQDQNNVYPVPESKSYPIGTILMTPLGPVMLDQLQWSISGLDGADRGAYSLNAEGTQMMIYRDYTDSGGVKRYHTQDAYGGHVVPMPPPFNLASSSLDNFVSQLAADDQAAVKQFPLAQAALDKAIADLAADSAKVQAAATLKDVAALAKVQAATDANTAAVDALTQQLQTLQDQLLIAQGKAANNPTDPALQQAVDDLKRALEDLVTQQKAQEAAKAQEEADEATIPESTPDTLKTINWEPLLALKGVLSTTFPFNLLSQVTGYLSGLVREPVAPTFNFPLPFDQTIHVDLAIFDPVATVSRWVFALCSIIGAIFLANAFYRGN